MKCFMNCCVKYINNFMKEYTYIQYSLNIERISHTHIRERNLIFNLLRYSMLIFDKCNKL